MHLEEVRLDGHGALLGLAAVERRVGLLQAPGRCRGSRRVVLKAAPFIGEQRGVLLKAVCKPTFAVRSRDKVFEA